MKKILTIACLFALSHVEARVSLSNLMVADKTACLERLEKATDTELWDVFLEGQATLFFESECAWIAKQPWWQEAKNILEIGSGNGSYLYKLSQRFQDKTYRGVEKLPSSVKDANERYSRSNVDFHEGDAEVFDDRLINSADIVLFRLTLQYLQYPCAALENAFHYLSPDGYVVIIDSCDRARRSSHPISVIDETLALVAETQKESAIGNRKITLELLQALETKESPIRNMYELMSSNLDMQGTVIGDCIRFQGETSRILYCNHSLLFLTLFHRTKHISVNLNRAYDELQEYLHDENAWVSPGVHLLVLKKKHEIER